MKARLASIASLSLLALGLAWSTAASAQATYTYTWTMSADPCDESGGTPGTAGCAKGTDPTVTATVTAWANTAADDYFKRANLTDQGGRGIGATSVSSTGSTETTSSPHHAFDSLTTCSTGFYCGGSTEMALIDFSTAAVTLDSITIGWWGSDADISVLRWTGSAAPDLTTMTATGTNGLVLKGWEIVKSADVDGGTPWTTNATKTMSTGATLTSTSSWWLVSTYFGSDDASQSLYKGNDSFKFLAFTATGTKKNDVPEPSSLALLGAAALGVFGARRRRPVLQGT